MNLEQEQKHLDYVRSEAMENYETAQVECDDIVNVIEEKQQYLQANRSSLRDSGDFESIPQMINEINALFEKYDTYKENVEKLKMIMSQPYFGSFIFNDEKFYIGRFGMQNANKNEFLIADWRAPISSMYYDYEVGDAKFKTPDGWEKGKISEKLQFKIENGKLIYCFDLGININDEVLQQTLAESTSTSMKTIIATIQKKQNEIIRQGIFKTTIVQGVAGSGKTSIALHRIAYLLYSNRKSITSQNILIFSPNKIFSSYISLVLPSLGEKQVKETTFDEIFREEFFEVCQVEKRSTYVEKLITNTELATKTLQIKNSKEYLERLNAFLDNWFKENFEPQDIDIKGRAFGKDLIRDYLKERKTGSSFEKFSFIANGFVSLLSVKRAMQVEYEEKLKVAIIHALIKTLKTKNIFNIYKAFEASEGREFERSEFLNTEDAFALLYIKNYIFGPNIIKGIKHVVVDEMQDYSAMALAVINQMYPCEKTILGDIHQAVDKRFDEHQIETIKAIEGDNIDLIHLTKNYRSTYEIFMLACRVLGVMNGEDPIRHGEKPSIEHIAKDTTIQNIKNKIKELRNNGTTSIGVLTKTTGEAIKLYKELKDMNASVITPETATFEEGVVVAASHFAKGLEFDAVIIPYCDKQTYKTDLDRQSMYVALTRALHKVYMTHETEISEFLK